MNIQYDPPTGGGLYILRLSDTHFYGGRTCDFQGRWGQHLRDLLNKRHKNKHMQAVFDLHQCFLPEVLEVVSIGEGQVLAEQQWLDTYWGTSGCLNLSKVAWGCMQGRTHTEEAKAKMRARIYSAEFRAKAAATQKGKVASPGTRAKMSDSQKGRVLTPEHICILTECSRNRIWSEESLQRLRESHLGHVRSPESRAKQSATLRASPELQEKARAALEQNRVKKGGKKSAEAIRKNSEAQKGKKLSPEHIEKIASKHRGRKNTEETKRLMSDSAKKRVALAPPQHGKETRALISVQQKGRVWINDGVMNQRLFPEEAALLIGQGWLRGRV